MKLFGSIHKNIIKLVMGLIDKVKQKEPEMVLFDYTQEELEFLLNIIKEANFKGKDLPLLVNLVNKIQQQYKSLK
jgi:hypothetical protein